jgi:protein SCO1/2
MHAFDGTTPAEDIASFVDRVRSRPMLRDGLVELLPEQSPIYSGRGANEAERLRGYILASFERIGLPPPALDYVLEELESGIHPYGVAAAAKALRGTQRVPAKAAPLLLQAIARIGLTDERVDFDGWHGAPQGSCSTTALMEVFRTLAWLGPRAAPVRPALVAMRAGDGAFAPALRTELHKAIAAIEDPVGGDSAADDCCCAPRQPAARMPDAGVTADGDLAGLELQDQDGARLSYGEFFLGQPSVVTFFYTRCMNPNKCSLNITKVGRLQRRLQTEDLRHRVNVAVVTYDPAFDLPPRLRAYCAERGVAFDHHNRGLRTTGEFAPMQRRFDLGVGYGGSTVNQHRSELFVLDERGLTRLAVTRIQWDEDDVVRALHGALAGG